MGGDAAPELMAAALVHLAEHAMAQQRYTAAAEYAQRAVETGDEVRLSLRLPRPQAVSRVRTLLSQIADTTLANVSQLPPCQCLPTHPLPLAGRHSPGRSPSDSGTGDGRRPWGWAGGRSKGRCWLGPRCGGVA